jgi:hypothetical protein
MTSKQMIEKIAALVGVQLSEQKAEEQKAEVEETKVEETVVELAEEIKEEDKPKEEGKIINEVKGINS